MTDSVLPAVRRHTALSLLREPAGRRAWAELRYVVISVPLALASFVFAVVTTLIGIVGFGVLIGPPVLAVSSLGARGLAAVSRELARRLLGAPVAPPPPPFRPRPGLVGWISSGITDAASWRARAYLVLKLPVTALAVLAVGYTWVIGLSAVTFPLRWLILSELHAGRGFASPPFGGMTALEANLVLPPLGAVGLIAAPWLLRIVLALDLALITRLIGPASLTERVRDLERTRRHLVDDSATQLRRIERDLHDGAQAKMVAVAMKLALATENLGAAGQTAEADARLLRALELVDAAHGIAKEAITELRDLVRGIHPPVLDRGLDTALTTLAARSGVPVELVTDMPERPSAAIEAIAYFCAAELLANVGKHSGARHVTLEAVHVHGLLLLRVSDDGTGGARAGRGGGLAGLTERLRTVDGRMRISSPPEGPTVVTIELPSHA